jgi:YVTN family beta-propeller protein
MISRAVFAALLCCATAAAAAPASYSVTKTVKLGAPDKWDYVVLEAGRLYVAHGDRVTVLDAASGAIAGQIGGDFGTAHGIAPVPALGKGYIGDRKGAIVVFDLKTLKVLKTLKGQDDADGAIYDAKSGHVLVVNGDSANVSVVDPRTDTVVATMAGGGGLEFGVSGENGKFYVDGADKGEIVRFDLATNKADAHWPMKGCIEPHGIAMDRAHMRLFSTCANGKMAVVNADSGAVVAMVPIGLDSDFAVFDETRHLALSSNRDGTLSIVAQRTPDRYDALPAFKTQPSSRTMAIDQKTGRIFLASPDASINTALPAGDAKRYVIKPGSLKLLFLDPK